MGDGNKIVYSVASLGIILDKSKNTQLFLGGGKADSNAPAHTAEITALSVSWDGKLIATAESGKEPLICIWGADKGNSVVTFKHSIPNINAKYCRFFTLVH